MLIFQSPADINKNNQILGLCFYIQALVSKYFLSVSFLPYFVISIGYIKSDSSPPRRKI